ncbi:hypothetical protein ABRQ03_18320, partial [Pectobacterium jejuense]|uniref:hypothetical protein n=1 Tax=Pectobacterium jejuense TaxID=2974022 RepID=UPI0032ED9F28
RAVFLFSLRSPLYAAVTVLHPFTFPLAFILICFFSIVNGYRCVHIALLQKRYFLFVLSLNKTASSGWLLINRPMQNNE